MTDLSTLPPLVLSALNPPMDITLVTAESGLEALSAWVAEKLANNGRMGLDTETNICDDFYFRKVRTIQVGDKHRQFVIDLLSFAGSSEALSNNQGNYKLHPCFKPVFDILTPALCDNKVLKVGQSLWFEYIVFLWNFGQRIWHLYSTDLAERVIQAGAISLKQMSEFSMASIVARRFNLRMDKTEQEGFDLGTPLTRSQIDYAALDCRMPLPIREHQIREMTTAKLLSTAQIENDALGAYADMHLNGMKLNNERWMKRIDAVTEARKEQLAVLDIEFIKYVGRKTEQIDFEDLKNREDRWRKGFELPTAEEMAKAEQIRCTRDNAQKAVLREELNALKKLRSESKKAARVHYNELGKRYTEVKRKLPQMEGEAYINYGSNDQLLEALQKMPGMKRLAGAGDEHLLKFNDRPFIQTLRKYRKGKKDTGTYGKQWTETWITGPGKKIDKDNKEGWVHPYDGRIHASFNQLEAETGRSSCSKPNMQNLPALKEVRACFICDPPDELLRISTCCEEYAEYAGNDYDTDGKLTGKIYGKCDKCGQIVPTKAEEYILVTTDMSGAELRIIAELAHATSWIRAFAKNQDVHSVSTEILEPEKWPAATAPGCAYYKLGADGEPERQKCECEGHIKLRKHTKAINFLLCYGGGPAALADELDITVDQAKELMQKHERAFPEVWKYLNDSGELAQRTFEARDLYWRRRLLPKPTPQSAAQYYKDEHADRLELSEDVQAQNLFNFKATYMREPTELEEYKLTHREPSFEEIGSAMRGLFGSIGRRGKNHCIQGSNASIIKRAMGCGFDKDGTPYLWHLLPRYGAKLLSMVHDELIVQCPKRFGEKVARIIADAFKRAAAEVMSQVVMEAEWSIAECWQK
jgi:DNA polymerase I-like protein with 3'-5' exonuclease and polymerase domains